MRAFLSFLVVMAFAVPSYAAESVDAQKPVLIKGSKSYQIRYPKPDMAAVQAVEPAAGVETNQTQSENMPAIATPSDDNGYGKKVMKLHGKK